MGGTFMRLHDQGHEVHVGYQTSGNIAVTDEFVTRFMILQLDLNPCLELIINVLTEILKNAKNYLKEKKIPDRFTGNPGH